MVKNFIIKRGDEFSFTVTFKNLTKEPDELLFGLKQYISQDDYDDYLSIGNGIEKIDNFIYSVRLSPEQSDKLACDNYTYDLRFRIDQTIKTPLSGKLSLRNTVFN